MLTVDNGNIKLYGMKVRNTKSMLLIHQMILLSLWALSLGPFVRAKSGKEWARLSS